MYCEMCRLTFGSAEERIRVGPKLFHLRCFEAAVQRALVTGSVVVFQPRRMLVH
jgi:hypothetical protein